MGRGRASALPAAWHRYFARIEIAVRTDVPRRGHGLVVTDLSPSQAGNRAARAGAVVGDRITRLIHGAGYGVAMRGGNPFCGHARSTGFVAFDPVATTLITVMPFAFPCHGYVFDLAIARA